MKLINLTHKPFSPTVHGAEEPNFTVLTRTLWQPCCVGTIGLTWPPSPAILCGPIGPLQPPPLPPSWGVALIYAKSLGQSAQHAVG